MDMEKHEPIAREALEKLLLPGEQLLAIGKFDEQLSFGKALFVPALINVMAANYYWVGVTKERLIFIPLDASDKPTGTENYMLARTDVVYKSLMLTVILPNSPKPQKLLPNFGMKKLTGFDEKAFRAAMDHH